MKKTPLYEKHMELKGKLIDFGGWELPVEYSGIIPEHEAVEMWQACLMYHIWEK